MHPMRGAANLQEEGARIVAKLDVFARHAALLDEVERQARGPGRGGASRHRRRRSRSRARAEHGQRVIEKFLGRDMSLRVTSRLFALKTKMSIASRVDSKQTLQLQTRYNVDEGGRLDDMKGGAHVEWARPFEWRDLCDPGAMAAGQRSVPAHPTARTVRPLPTLAPDPQRQGRCAQASGA